MAETLATQHRLAIIILTSSVSMTSLYSANRTTKKALIQRFYLCGTHQMDKAKTSPCEYIRHQLKRSMSNWKLNWDNFISSTEISNIREIVYFPSRQYKNAFKVLLDTPEPQRIIFFCQALQIICNLLICFIFSECLPMSELLDLWKSFIINYTTAQKIVLLTNLLWKAACNWSKITIIDQIWTNQ